MKIVKTILTVLAFVFSLNACASKTASDATKSNSDMKSVIVYFTHSGNTELAANRAGA